MKKTLCNICPKFLHIMPYIFCGLFLMQLPATAAVVQRGATTSRPSAARMPTMTTSSASSSATTTTTTTTATTPAATTSTVATPDIEVANKSAQFENIIGTSAASGVDSSASSLAEMIQRQRAALDSQDAAITADLTVQNTLSGMNACDTALRSCMQNKCGKDYSKCKGDTDTIWGDKMDSCRRETTCTGQEYALFVPEIKADRDMNAKIGAFTAIIDCGNEYNDCIVQQCGTTYSKCLGKTAGDAAIAKCATIAKNCTQQDSGLAGRTMNVFGTLRQDAEVQIKKDEERLYALRDQMRSQCARMGAMLDERSLDCVFTVSLYAGSDSKLFASKKAYAGSTFDCTQNWFGIDITTFKENAYRETRAQESATSAFMGSGIGMAVGAVTSGAIDRAMDRHKAEQAVKKAEKEHDENYGDKKSDKSDESDAEDSDDESDVDNNAEVKDTDKETTKDNSKDKKNDEKKSDKDGDNKNKNILQKAGDGVVNAGKAVGKVAQRGANAVKTAVTGKGNTNSSNSSTTSSQSSSQTSGSTATPSGSGNASTESSTGSSAATTK